jgi:hypothetical protein
MTTLITAPLTSPLWGAIDTRDKLRQDHANPVLDNPPLDTSVLEESYQMHLLLQDSLDNSESSECTDLECVEPECERKRGKIKNVRRVVYSSSDDHDEDSDLFLKYF